MVSFQVGDEGWPSKYTRLIFGLFLRWISELRSVLYSGVSEQNNCYKEKYHVAKNVYSANDGYE